MKKYLFVLLYFYGQSCFCQTYSLCFKGTVRSSATSFQSNFENLKIPSKGDSVVGYIRYTSDNKLYINNDSTLYRFTSPFVNEIRIRIGKLEFSSSPMPIFNLEIPKSIPTSQISVGNPDLHFRSDKNQFPLLELSKWKQNSIELFVVDSSYKVYEKIIPVKFDPASVYTSLQIIGESATPSSPITQTFALVITCHEVKFECLDALTFTDNESSPQSFRITPNPSSSGIFHLETVINPTNIQVFNGQGNTVISSLTDSKLLDLSEYPKGLYIMVATVNGRISTKRLLIE